MVTGSPTTKDLKKPHSPRGVGGVQMQRELERHGEAWGNGGGTEPWEWCREVEEQGGGMGSPIFTCGRYKLGGMPLE